MGLESPRSRAAYCSPQETVKKRIQRAKRSLADAQVSLEVPEAEELDRRLAVVHEVLYLMFNEGYSTTHGPEPIRDDVCEEATRLCHLLATSPHASPATKALLALLLFHAARLDARMDESGAVILLGEQDRSKWDRKLIGIGEHWLALSRDGRPTRFHFEALIAMEHCQAVSAEATNWPWIVACYDQLQCLGPSPLYALNRAIALAQTGETGEALSALHELRDRRELNGYLLLDCAIARVHELEGHHELALEAYTRALQKSPADHEQALLARKIADLRQHVRSS